MMTPGAKPASVASMGLSKAECIELCDTLRDKAQQAHQDARAWMNRALVAEARLAVLRTAYEPPGHRKSMNNQPTTKEGI